MFTLTTGGKIWRFERTAVMGIINLTPDSFYAASRHRQVDAVLHQAEKMITEGAELIDLGGQSTRPGSETVTEEEELQRILEPLAALHERFPDTLLSVDTFYARVAREAVAAGAGLVNDISAGRMDPALWETVAALQVPYVLMHMQGTPATMQQQPAYSDVVAEVRQFFDTALLSLEAAGISQVILDPGFGFGKTPAHNLQLLKGLRDCTRPGHPVLVGVSRKSTLSRLLQVPVEETLNGTTVLHAWALQNGASVLRVHDVKEAVQAVRLWEAYRQA